MLRSHASVTAALRPFLGHIRAWHRNVMTCSERLAPLEKEIAAGLNYRLEGLGASPRIGVVGHLSVEFAASMRAVRGVGGAAVPLDAALREDDLLYRLAESRVHLALISGAAAEEAEIIQAVARRLGIPAADTASLSEHLTDLPMDSISAGASSDGPALHLFTKPWYANAPRVVEISRDELERRVAHTAGIWGFDSQDVVLPLGLSAGTAPAIVDALEAPLAAGASVILPDAALRSVWDLWAELRDAASTATVIMVAASDCQRLVETHAELGSAVKKELAALWEKKPLRCSIMSAPPGQTPSVEIAARWADIFRGHLTWRFGCAEAGVLYTVRSSENGALQGKMASGFEWDLRNDELWVRGQGLGGRYFGRPKSTEAMFQDGFCRTGHHVTIDEEQKVSPKMPTFDIESNRTAHHFLYRAKGPQQYGMKPDWRVRKVFMRKYYWWRAAKGYKYPVRKHTNVMRRIYKKERP